MLCDNMIRVPIRRQHVYVAYLVKIHACNFRMIELEKNKNNNDLELKYRLTPAR